MTTHHQQLKVKTLWGKELEASIIIAKVLTIFQALDMHALATFKWTYHVFN